MWPSADLFRPHRQIRSSHSLGTWACRLLMPPSLMGVAKEWLEWVRMGAKIGLAHGCSSTQTLFASLSRLARQISEPLFSWTRMPHPLERTDSMSMLELALCYRSRLLECITPVVYRASPDLAIPSSFRGGLLHQRYAALWSFY